MTTSFPVLSDTFTLSSCPFNVKYPPVQSNKPFESYNYRGADKSLARPDWKKRLKGRHFSSDAEVIAAAETWLDGQPSELFLSDLQKLEFGHCSLFPYWSDGPFTNSVFATQKYKSYSSVHLLTKWWYLLWTHRTLCGRSANVSGS
jgi:hypothetical protein